MLPITALETHDVRFPTSRELDGSDAMNPHPDYSAAYVILRTDGQWEGHGLAFTIGRGNEVVIAGIEALAPLVLSLTLQHITATFRPFCPRLAGATPLRCFGPDNA